MPKSYLLIVEGAVTEKDILLSVLSDYGYKTCDCGKIDFAVKLDDMVLKTLGDTSGDTIFVAQGPRNRICDWLKLVNTQYEDFERYFDNLNTCFAGIFIIYDVDHTSNDELEQMTNKYADETSNGLLLLSSPCIEVIADRDRTDELCVDHLTDYKKELNKRYDKVCHCSAKQYVIDNFDELVLYYLKKNVYELRSDNVMDHPRLVMNEINRLNDRKESGEVRYRYFTTVIYVCIAYIKGLTKKIDNAEAVKEFFESRLQK